MRASTTRAKRDGRTATRRGVVLVSMLGFVLSGCSTGLPELPKIPTPSLPTSFNDLNPFKKTQKPLPGKRVPVLAAQRAGAAPGELADAAKPIVIPPPSANGDWSQPGGTTSNAPGHLALGASIKKSWSVSAGAGSSTSGRLTATPLVYGGRAYTLDSAATVSAFALGSGARVWQASLKPDTENVSGGFFPTSVGSLFPSSSARGGYGGGLAAGEGKVFGVSGFGSIAAFDASSGRKIWDRRLTSPIRAAPTVADGRLYVVTLDGRALCLSTVDGTDLWEVPGLPQQASLVTNVSPAVNGDVVVVPYPSGDLIALKASDGSTLWTESLSGRSSRATQLVASLRNASSPAIADGVVYAVGHSGRLIATQTSSGERLWSVRVAGTQTPYVAGGSVYVVSTSGQLFAVSRDDGKIQWTMKLPGDEKTWSGPVLAGGSLWLVSSKGNLVGVDPASGRAVKQVAVGSDVFVQPVVAQNRMLVLTDSARLVSYN